MDQNVIAFTSEAENGRGFVQLEAMLRETLTTVARQIEAYLLPCSGAEVIPVNSSLGESLLNC